ncbi:hypothetical protein F4604DRAFT_1920588 [Suillus subluteus]|nr:hypothetical protein F4604DRAFT_1920588 [Suillus subluteus]
MCGDYVVRFQLGTVATASLLSQVTSVDTPEAMMLATIGGKTSPVTMAMFKQFGDPFQHEPRAGSTTARTNNCLSTNLSGRIGSLLIHHTSSLLKISITIHREFFDHDIKWIICAVKEAEIDFRFLALQAHDRISPFSWWYLKAEARSQGVPNVIYSAQSLRSVRMLVPSAVMTAVRALMDFRYLVQSPRINDHDIERISAALAEFHANKHAITAAGLRCGKSNKPIDNWYIPKIELMQNIVPSICNTGVTMQWSADAMEHAHITEIKDPARSSNNNNYDSQICRHLDRADKCRHFDLATIDSDDDDGIPADLLSTVKRPGYARPITDYFAITKVLQHRDVGTVPLPLRTFIVGYTAFHLAYSPSIRAISVHDAAIKFGLPDLRPAIADFLRREDAHGYHHVHPLGGARRAGSDASLPFDNLQIWFKLRLQNTEFHDSTNVRPVQTLNCAPPSDIWTFGRYDTVIVNNEDGHSWPADGLCSD